MSRACSFITQFQGFPADHPIRVAAGPQNTSFLLCSRACGRAYNPLTGIIYDVDGVTVTRDSSQSCPAIPPEKSALEMALETSSSTPAALVKFGIGASRVKFHPVFFSEADWAECLTSIAGKSDALLETERVVRDVSLKRSADDSFSDDVAAGTLVHQHMALPGSGLRSSGGLLGVFALLCQPEHVGTLMIPASRLVKGAAGNIPACAAVNDGVVTKLHQSGRSWLF